MTFFEILTVVPTLITAGAAVISHIKGKRYKKAAEESARAIGTIVTGIEIESNHSNTHLVKKRVKELAKQNGVEQSIINPMVCKVSSELENWDDDSTLEENQELVLEMINHVSMKG